MKKRAYRVLIVGGDARAHALYNRCAYSPSVEHLIVAPGNGGVNEKDRRNVGVMDFPELVRLCLIEEIDIVIVSPEAPLVGDGRVGITDYFRTYTPHIMVFGPDAAAAQLEGSKIFGYNLAKKCGIRVPESDPVRDLGQAIPIIVTHLDASGAVVIKMDGLAAGKGVLVTDNIEEAAVFAENALTQGPLLVQEKLTGPEVSFICFVSGTVVVPLVCARDFKRAHDGDLGLNTGGMGAYAPLTEYPTDGPIYAQMLKMAQATAEGMAKEAHPYVGFLYLGLMVVGDDVHLIEYNCRGGSPETETLMNLLRGDVFPYFVACCEGTLSEMPPLVFHDGASVCVVVASENYPGEVKPSGIIPHEWFLSMGDHEVKVCHAGTSLTKAGYTPTGGRVFMLTARGPTVAAARGRIYEALDSMPPPFPGAWWRKDIALGV